MRATPTGIDLETHQALGRTLQRWRAEALAMRRTIKAGCGSASIEYQAVTMIISQCKRLGQVMALSAAASHAGKVSLETLKGWYDGQGEDPCEQER